jgi:hypothetical protein
MRENHDDSGSKVRKIIRRLKPRYSMLLGRLTRLGNFIKPVQDTNFHGPQSEAPAFEKSEKSWRDHNYCKRHRLGAAWLFSWSAVCILWRPMHSWTWNHIRSLEIVDKKRNHNGCHFHCSGTTIIVTLKYNFSNRMGSLTANKRIQHIDSYSYIVFGYACA